VHKSALRLWKQPNQWYELSSANSSSPTAARLQRNGPPLLSSQLRFEGGPDLVHLAGSRRREVLSTVPSCDQAPVLWSPPQMAAPPCQSGGQNSPAHFHTIRKRPRGTVESSFGAEGQVGSVANKKRSSYPIPGSVVFASHILCVGFRICRRKNRRNGPPSLHVNRCASSHAKPWNA
jgi:hypothetical protein